MIDLPATIMKTKSNRFGHFENPQGYDAPKIRDEKYLIIFTKAIYDFRLDSDTPLTYCAPDGTRIQPDRHFESDMGSIPLTLQVLIPKDRFLLSFYIHDSGYKDGGLYIAQPRSDAFRFTPMEREEVDTWLEMMVGAEDGNIVQRSVIHAGVWAGGWASWHGWDK